MLNYIAGPHKPKAVMFGYIHMNIGKVVGMAMLCFLAFVITGYYT